MIFINGQKCLVRANLWSALNQLRNEHTERILCVDALCINQYDTFERNHQVGQMTKIYEQATRVICWIGVDEGVEFPSAHNIDSTEFVPSIAIRTLQALSRSGRRSDQNYLLRDCPIRSCLQAQVAPWNHYVDCSIAHAGNDFGSSKSWLWPKKYWFSAANVILNGEISLDVVMI